MGEREATDGDTSVSSPLVRPKGYVEDRPIIRRIGERNLYLGNAQAVSHHSHDGTFDFVLSATTETYPLTTHHHPLTDGHGNEWSAFEAAVDTARTLYRREGSVLIHCKAGISRSTTLVALTLATEEQRSFRDAVAIIQEARPFAMPNPSLHELAVVYLAAHA